MEQEYTQEESDALILQEMWLAEENSTTNEEVEVEETMEEEVETEEEETEEEIVEDKTPPKKWIAKVLHQRNEARKEAEDAKKLAQELQEKLATLEAEGNYWNEEYIKTLVAQEMAKQKQTESIFADEEVREFKNEILTYAKENNLSVDIATKVYLADNRPDLLLNEADRNKKQSAMYKVWWVTPKKVTNPKFDYSDAEFDSLVKKGVIKF